MNKIIKSIPLLIISISLGGCNVAKSRDVHFSSYGDVMPKEIFIAQMEQKVKEETGKYMGEYSSASSYTLLTSVMFDLYYYSSTTANDYSLNKEDITYNEDKNFVHIDPFNQRTISSTSYREYSVNNTSSNNKKNSHTIIVNQYGEVVGDDYYTSNLDTGEVHRYTTSNYYGTIGLIATFNSVSGLIGLLPPSSNVTYYINKNVFTLVEKDDDYNSGIAQFVFRDGITVKTKITSRKVYDNSFVTSESITEASVRSVSAGVSKHKIDYSSVAY